MTSSTLTSPSPSAASPAAPLRALLGDLRRQTRRWIWVESLARLGLAAAVFFWTSLALDWGIEPPAWVRITMLALGLCGLTWVIATSLLGRLFTPLTDAALALVVERTHPRCGDSLSTAIELADTPRADVDPELVRRTTADALAMLGEIRSPAIFRRRRLALQALAGALAMATVVGLAAARPAMAGLWARRMLALTDEPWPRRVRLEVEGFTAGVRTVARGSDVDLVVHASAAGGPPDLVELRTLGPDGWRTERMGLRGAADAESRSFGHVIRTAVADTELEIRGGDARLAGLRLRVVDPPDVADVAIDFQPPAYLGGDERRMAAARVVRVPRGSRVRLTCTATKPLSAARLVLTSAAPAAAEPATLAELKNDDAAERRTISAEIAALDADAGVELELTDTEGLPNREPIRMQLVAVADEPPQLAVALQGVSTAVTPRARLPMEGRLSDDHGLAAAAVVCSGRDGGELARRPIDRIRGNPPTVAFAAESPEIVPLESLGLEPGGRLSIVVEAHDTCGLSSGPNVARSDSWTLDVVTPEALRSLLEAREILLRRRFETVIGDLSQARDVLAAPPQPASPPSTAESATDSTRNDAANDDALAAPAVRCGEAAARAAGETGEIAAAFRLIRRELEVNGVLTPELESRLAARIAAPLEGLAAVDLPALARDCRGAPPAATLVPRADAVLARMRAVLDTMIELESFNQLVDRLRAVIRTQEDIRAETLEQQKKRGRQILEGP